MQPCTVWLIPHIGAFRLVSSSLPVMVLAGPLAPPSAMCQSSGQHVSIIPRSLKLAGPSQSPGPHTVHGWHLYYASQRAPISRLTCERGSAPLCMLTSLPNHIPWWIRRTLCLTLNKGAPSLGWSLAGRAQWRCAGAVQCHEGCPFFLSGSPTYLPISLWLFPESLPPVLAACRSTPAHNHKAA